MEFELIIYGLAGIAIGCVIALAIVIAYAIYDYWRE